MAKAKISNKTVKKPAKKAVKKVDKTATKSIKKQTKVDARIVKKSPKVEKSVNRVDGLKKLTPLLLVVIVVVGIAIGIALFSTRPRVINVENVNTIEEINDALKFKLKKPDDTNNVTYGIENDSVARVEYKKTTVSGSEMTFVMRASSSLEENLAGLDNSWGTPILMTVICTDGSDIEVMSYVAIDDSKIMKGEWYDNDLYYSMTTDCLTSREDFLQEINRVIINNHVEF